MTLFGLANPGQGSDTYGDAMVTDTTGTSTLSEYRRRLSTENSQNRTGKVGGRRSRPKRALTRRGRGRGSAGAQWLA
jgi:hypothetical protein